MMDAGKIIAQAQEQAGADIVLEPSVREGLEVLVDATNREARLSEAGAERWEASLVQHLLNRVRVLDYLDRNPGLRERPIDRPSFVFGLPRTGTTLTINLLNADPARRCLLRWEALNPVPPVAAGATSTDPRCLAEQARIDYFVKVAPSISAAHHENADSPSECQYAMAPSFSAQLFDASINVPSYRKWLFAADQLPAFRFHKQLLQVLQEHESGRWTLKNPWHPLWLDDLVTVYPDARLVMTHRDPVEVVGSACSLIRLIRPMYSEQVDLAEIAAQMLETFDLMIVRQNAFRAEHGDDAIHDIRYVDQLRDPIGEMRRLYARFGEELTSPAQTAMEQLLRDQPKGKHGAHHYDLAEFGLTAQGVQERYRDYREQFGL